MSETSPSNGKLGLVAKLCQAGAAIGWIEKSGRNNFHNYAYATEADLVAALRGELYKRNVFVFPCVLQQDRKQITVISQKGSRETALTDVMIRWTFVDGETGEKFECDVPGCGEDSGDKGIYKAMTGSEKYLLMKAFLIPTGDDPEKDTDTEKKDAFQNGKEAAQAVAQRKIAEHASRTSGDPDWTRTGRPSSATAADNRAVNPSEKAAALKTVLFSDTDMQGVTRITGDGLAELLVSLDKKDPYFKQKFMKYEEDLGLWFVMSGKADILADIVVSLGMDAKASHGVREIAPKSVPEASGEGLANAPKGKRSANGQQPLITAGEVMPKIEVLRTTKATLWLRWGDVEVGCFKHPYGNLWQHLTDGNGYPADLIVEEGKPNPNTGRPYINVIGIRQIGKRKFDEAGVPVRTTADIGSELPY